MFVKQLSVFIENREGRLEKVTETLKDHNINIVSLSLADTSEYGMLRLIVSDPSEGKRVLKENGFSAMLTDVLAVKLPHKIGMLQEFLNVLLEEGLNVEYMYTLATGADNASIIVKTSDGVKALEALLVNHIGVYSAEEAYSINE